MNPTSPRLFIALFPSLRIVRALAERIEAWKEQLPDPRLRWVPPENLHLTLCFLGDVDAERIPDLEAALGAVPLAGPIELRLNGLGAFPGNQRPRVLWAGIAGDIARMASFQVQIQEAALPFAQRPDPKPFSPHLTLARIKEGDGRLGRAVRRLVQAEAETEFGAWPATEIQLMKSVLGADRSRYEVLARFPALGTPGGHAEPKDPK